MDVSLFQFAPTSYPLNQTGSYVLLHQHDVEPASLGPHDILQGINMISLLARHVWGVGKLHEAVSGPSAYTYQEIFAALVSWQFSGLSLEN